MDSFPSIDFGRADLSLRERVAIVTGASRGLGEAIALGYAHAGADLVLAARHEADLERVAAAVRRLGRAAHVVVTDVTVPAECERLAEAAIRAFGRIDILMNNAGLPRGAAPAVTVTADQWDELMKANLYSAFYCCQAVGRHMLERGYGKIINMSSQMGLVGYRDRAAYCAAKGGLNQLTKALAVEWAPFQVTVNALAPTHIETPANSSRVQDPAFVAEMLPRIPMGRFGRWEDVIGAAVFFASAASDLVTGQILAIDGGWTAM
jgi:NAD(P)-dependent dehydrogenase (short-subunit alcohol dehydrogenase family)